MQGQINLFGKIEEKHLTLNLVVSPILSALDMFSFCPSTDARKQFRDRPDRLYFIRMIIILSFMSGGHVYPRKKLRSGFNLLWQEMILVVVIIFDFMSLRSL